MRLPLFQVDAFADELFGGNPAAVVLLDATLPDAVLQAMATENQLSETAFVRPRGEGFDLRWFTPAVEVDLCGHATLATAFVLFEQGLVDGDTARFHTASGRLEVRREGGAAGAAVGPHTWLHMDFPSRPPEPAATPDGLARALGARPAEVWAARDLVAVFEGEDEVAGLTPDFGLLAQLDAFAVCATAPGREVDFVSRFFAPAKGVPEDPVTGSAHCTLTPFWAERLGTRELTARQIGPRGGSLRCAERGDRVTLSGRVVPYLRGEIDLGEHA